MSNIEDVGAPLFNMDLGNKIIGQFSEEMVEEDPIERATGLTLDETSQVMNDSEDDFEPPVPRFKNVSDDLSRFQAVSKAESTHKNTRWATKIFCVKFIIYLGNFLVKIYFLLVPFI